MKIDRESVVNFLKSTFNPNLDFDKLHQIFNESFESTERHIQDINDLHKDHLTTKVNITDRIATKQALLDAQRIALSIGISSAENEGDIETAETIMRITVEISKEIGNYLESGESDHLDPGSLLED